MDVKAFRNLLYNLDKNLHSCQFLTSLNLLVMASFVAHQNCNPYLIKYKNKHRIQTYSIQTIVSYFSLSNILCPHLLHLSGERPSNI